jgi:hypothetical protein
VHDAGDTQSDADQISYPDEHHDDGNPLDAASLNKVTYPNTNRNESALIVPKANDEIPKPLRGRRSVSLCKAIDMSHSYVVDGR